jgi:hypothetical protein
LHIDNTDLSPAMLLMLNDVNKKSIKWSNYSDDSSFLYDLCNFPGISICNENHKVISHYLICSRYDDKNHIPITTSTFSVGRYDEERASDYMVSKNERAVSRQHFIIYNRNKICYIVDNNSANGTLLNGQKLTPGEEAELSDGDIIKPGFGSLSFVYSIEAKIPRELMYI